MPKPELTVGTATIYLMLMYLVNLAAKPIPVPVDLLLLHGKRCVHRMVISEPYERSGLTDGIRRKMGNNEETGLTRQTNKKKVSQNFVRMHNLNLYLFKNVVLQS